MHLGTVCSSFVWINQATSRRSKALPLGETSLPHVSLGNRLTEKSASVAQVCYARGGWFTWEQPCGSKMFDHPSCQMLLQWTRVAEAGGGCLWRTELRLGDFAAATAKPIWLYSPIQELVLHLETVKAEPVHAEHAPVTVKLLCFPIMAHCGMHYC